MTRKRVQGAGDRRARARRRGLAAALGVFSTAAVAVTCPPWLYVDEWVSPVFAAAEAQILAALTAVDTLLGAPEVGTIDLYTNKINAAIAVLTAQKATTGREVSETERAASQQVATAFATLSESRRTKRARFDFGGEFGQGIDPCRIHATRNMIATRDAEMGEERGRRVMSEIVAAPGTYADPVQARDSMLTGRDEFCTRNQSTSGQCKNLVTNGRYEGELPGADINVATLFEPAMEGEALYDAKVRFVNHVVGLPDAAVPQSAATTTAATAYMEAKAIKDARVSPALASLKELQLEYSGVDAAHGGPNVPIALFYRNEVKRYAGDTAEHTEWARRLAAQNERGALVELLKVKALDLSIMERQYRQYERMEAMLASVVAMDAEAMAKARVDAAAGQAQKDRRRQQVQGM